MANRQVPMRFSQLKRAVAALGVIAALGCAAALAQTPSISGVGRTPTDDEIKAWAHSSGPSGKDLPPGKGTAKEGEPIYVQKCAFCHGRNLEGVPRVTGSGVVIGGPRLGGGRDAPLWGPERNAPLTVGNYKAFATTVFDVIYRAMPQYQGGSLTPDEAYALAAFILFKNDIIKQDAVMDRETLPKVEMPNRHGFLPDKLEDIPDIQKRGCFKTYGTCP